MARRHSRGEPTALTDPLATENPRHLAQFDRPRGPETTLAVAADPHLSPTAHGTIKMHHRSEQRLRTALEDAAARGVDATVVAGDVTKDGERAEYELATRLFRDGPSPLVAVPGNHDVAYDGDRGPVPDGRAFAGWRRRDPFPRTHAVGGAELHAIDSTCTDGTTKIGGAIDPETRRWLANRPEHSGPRVAVCHHPLGPVPEPFATALPEQSYRLSNPDVVADALVAAGVDLLLTGHVHWPYAGTYRGLNVVGLPSVSSFPPAYVLVTITPGGTTVSFVPVAGETGVREAYEFALEDDNRGTAIREAVSSGYFEGLLQCPDRATGGSVSGLS